REAGVEQELEERRQAGRNDGVEDDVDTTCHDVVDDAFVLHVIHREVLLADHRTALRRHDLTNLLVHRVRPYVVGGRHVEGLRPGASPHTGTQRLHIT